MKGVLRGVFFLTIFVLIIGGLTYLTKESRTQILFTMHKSEVYHKKIESEKLSEWIASNQNMRIIVTVKIDSYGTSKTTIIYEKKDNE